jgi:Ca2+-binding EF-hand superfamily protein
MAAVGTGAAPVPKERQLVMIKGVTSNPGHAYGHFEFKGIRENRFKKADSNNDGQVTKDELSTVLPKNGKGLSADEILTKVDTNQDGAIDQAENRAALETPRQSPSRVTAPDPEKLAARIFEATDADASGGISKEELTATLQKMKGRVSAEDVFKLLDTDVDGAITQAELTETLKNLFNLAKPADEQIEDPTGCTGYTNSGEGTSETPSESTFTATA